MKNTIMWSVFAVANLGLSIVFGYKLWMLEKRSEGEPKGSYRMETITTPVSQTELWRVWDKDQDCVIAISLWRSSSTTSVLSGVNLHCKN